MEQYNLPPNHRWNSVAHPRIVNANEWHADQPQGYEVYQGLSQQRNNQRINTGEWDDELLHNVGTVKEYTERSPKAYLNANTDFVHNDQTWD